VACCLTPNGQLAHRRAQLAAATARALHSPGAVGMPRAGV
jgi:hypothetical protein